MVKLLKSFKDAFRGIYVFAKSIHTYQVAFGLFILCVFVLGAGFYFEISQTEWLFVIFACGLVLVAEAFNTAIETVVNLVSPEQHPLARDAKDVSAGAVVIACITALAVAAVIYFPKIF